MGFYQRHLLPRCIDCVCSSPSLSRLRALAVPRAEGVVLELGAGSAPNLPFYDAARVRRLIALEPSAELRALAAQRIQRSGRPAGAFPVELLDGVGEAIPLPDASVDSVVCTYTLCTVTDPARTAAELMRVLRPGGRVHFAEHGLAGTERARRWQQRIKPAWVPLAGGCHLTRRPPDLLRAAGFEVEWQEGLMGPSTAAWRLVDRLMHGYWGCATARIQACPTTACGT